MPENRFHQNICNMDIVGAIKAFFSAIGNVFGWAQDSQKINNSPQMQERKAEQNEVNQDARDVKAIQDGDLDSVRKSLS